MPISVTYTNFGGQLVHENRGGVESFYTADPLGSIVDVRNSSGTQTFAATYWPYGEIRTSTGTNPSQFDFVGALGYYRENANRAYVRARVLRKELARWLNVDPLWPLEPGYLYAQASPSLITDSSGLQRNQSWYIGPPDIPGKSYFKDCDCKSIGGYPDSSFERTCYPDLGRSELNCRECMGRVMKETLSIVSSLERRYNMPPEVVNALRHCIGSCKGVRRCGCFCAQLTGELSELKYGEEPLDIMFDTHNNRIGRCLADLPIGRDCVESCLRAVEKGICWY
ncbi:MAG TPA: hypothetical protein PKA27_16375 [Fimbriimonadaceae bacterium]|nr:hypothetical protein [Fimbriimonadaceae bacterium]